jgi:hypothetical protein
LPSTFASNSSDRPTTSRTASPFLLEVTPRRACHQPSAVK